MIDMSAGIVKAPRLRCGSSTVRCLRSLWARDFEYKQVRHSCCIGRSMNGSIRPTHGRPPRVSMSNLSIFHCPNSKQRFGSPSCGLKRTDGKARTTKSSYTRERLCTNNQCEQPSPPSAASPVIGLLSSRWCVTDPLPPTAALPLTEGENRAKRARGSVTHHIELSNTTRSHEGND